MNPIEFAEMTRPQAWDSYLSALVSMNNHPGTTQGRAQKRSLEELVAEADAMLKERDKRFKGD